MHSDFSNHTSYKKHEVLNAYVESRNYSGLFIRSI